MRDKTKEINYKNKKMKMNFFNFFILKKKMKRKIKNEKKKKNTISSNFFSFSEIFLFVSIFPSNSKILFS